MEAIGILAGMANVKFWSRQPLTNDLNQISTVSLLMTSWTALANVGLFELIRRP